MKGKIIRRGSLDRISDLPTNVAEIILAHLPIIDAVRTSILSSKWRYLWCGIPRLVFDSNICPSRTFNQKNLMKKIFHVFLFHQGPILEFTLSISNLKSCPEIDQLMLFLSRNGLEKLVLEIWNGGALYKLPSAFFSCQRIKHLHLSYCEFKPPPKFEGFSRLITLEFVDVRIDGKSFERFIASCPLVEKLTLVNSRDYNTLQIIAPRLKYLCLEATIASLCLQNVPLLSTLYVTSYYSRTLEDEDDFLIRWKALTSIGLVTELPAIENLRMDYAFCESARAGGVPMLTHLKVLQLSEICFTEVNEVSCILYMIRSAPNIQKLFIKTFDKNDNPESVVEFLNSQDYSDVTLDQLREVNMEVVYGIDPELEIIKLILAKSHMLKIMRIQIGGRVEERLETMMKLAKFPRASVKAELICE